MSQKLTRRQFLALGSALSLTGALAACTPAPTPTTAPKVAPTQVPEPTSPPTAEPAPEPVSIRVGVHGSTEAREETNKRFKEMHPEIRCHPLEPANSPTLSTGYKVGKHRIQGISDEFIPPIVELSDLDKVVCVDDGDAILMAQKLAESCGPSSALAL